MLNNLRKHLSSLKLDGFIIPSWDAFQGEYIPESEKRLTTVTGFTGSNGIAVVMQKAAAFFTDGRYVLQAKQEVPREFEHYNLSEKCPYKWLEGKGGVIGFDPWLMTPDMVAKLEKSGIKSRAVEKNPVDAVWKNRPAAPASFVRIHPLEYAGEDSSTKRKRMGEKLKEKGADAFVITAPDSLCWLLNVRGNDIPFTPFLLSYAILHQNGEVEWFIAKNRLSPEVDRHLGKAVRTSSPDTLIKSIKKLKKKKIAYDPARTPYALYEAIPEKQRVEMTDPCQLAKACKNVVEREGMRQAHIRDGRAVQEFLKWLKKNLPTTELEASARLLSFRKKQLLFREPSFETISGFGSNGAIVHYRATPKTNKRIQKNGIYLLDSGGQYLDGTTDITRTLAIGKPTPEQKRHFTLVLKGHIAIATAIFPEGTTGAQLDTLARQYLWQEGLNYDHGTGHGVGSYLSVHEGPQRISAGGANNVALQPGMILSNEPGYYKAGEYGIRIENLLMVVEKLASKDNGKRYFGFETLTKVPFDKKLIDKSLLTKAEKSWLKNYQKFSRLS